MESHDNGINKDGTFRAMRIGSQSRTLPEIYSGLVTMSWRNFFILVFLAYLVVSLLFAVAFNLVDVENLRGLTSVGRLERFWEIFLYSAQTMSTIGGVSITPVGVQNNFILTLESMTALLCVAIVTGLLFVRFSRSTSKIAFSEKALIAPYKNGKGLMVRLANARKVDVVELSAHFFFVTFDPISNKRNFMELNLEQSQLPFSSTSWTIVHPITPDSPFSDEQFDQTRSKSFNLIIYISAIDSVTGQSVSARHSYTKRDIRPNSRFLPCSELNERGEIMVYLNKISDYEELAVTK